ncbi:unnamed protein product [Ixodes persulcatus]
MSSWESDSRHRSNCPIWPWTQRDIPTCRCPTSPSRILSWDWSDSSRVLPPKPRRLSYTDDTRGVLAAEYGWPRSSDSCESERHKQASRLKVSLTELYCDTVGEGVAELSLRFSRCVKACPSRRVVLCTSLSSSSCTARSCVDSSSCRSNGKAFSGTAPTSS